MVKLLFLCRRRPDITHERYASLLLEGHVPLALRHHPTLRRYTVNLVEAALAGAPALDSLGALWFDTLADFRERLYDSREGAQTIAADVAGFMGGADAYATREQVLHAPPDHVRPGKRRPGTKFVLCLTRTAGETREAFVRDWLECRAPAVLARPGVRGYVADVVEQRLGSDGPPYDGFAELYLAHDDTSAIRDLHPGPAYRVAEWPQR